MLLIKKKNGKRCKTNSRFLEKIQLILEDPENHYKLEHRNSCSFSCYRSSSCKTKLVHYLGRYFFNILRQGIGSEQILDTENGLRNQFANSPQLADIERNFIKKYTKLGLIRHLPVCIITELSLGIQLLTRP